METARRFSQMSERFDSDMEHLIDRYYSSIPEGLEPRGRAFFKWSYLGSEMLILSSVPAAQVEPLCQCNTLAILLNAMIDDLADLIGDRKLVDAAIVRLSSKRVDPPSVVPKFQAYVDLISDLYDFLADRMRAWPSRAQWTPARRRWLRRYQVAMHRSIDHNARIHAGDAGLTWVDLDRYIVDMSPPIHTGIFALMNLMASATAPEQELGAIERVARLSEQFMVMANWLATWEVEVAQADFSSGTVALAIECGVLDGPRIVSGEDDLVRRAIVNCDPQREFSIRMHSTLSALRALAHEIAHFDVDRYADDLEKVAQMHFDHRDMLKHDLSKESKPTPETSAKNILEARHPERSLKHIEHSMPPGGHGLPPGGHGLPPGGHGLPPGGHSDVEAANPADSPEPYFRNVAAYYEATDSSYQNWGDPLAYDLHYGYYDRPDTPHLKSLENMNRILATAASVGPDDRVLDAGCGVGASAIWLAKNRQAHVHGLTLAKVQQRKATQFAEQHGVAEQVTVSVGSYLQIPFADDTFDVVWGLESFCHAPSKRDVLKEAFRVLKPGGRLVISDYFLEREFEGLNALSRTILTRWFEGWSMPNLSSSRGFEDDIKRVGFDVMHQEDITAQIEPSALEIYRRGREGYPEEVVRDEPSLIRLRHVEGCLFQYVCLQQGLWRYRIMTARKPS